MTPFGDLMLAAQSALQTRVEEKEESSSARMDKKAEVAILLILIFVRHDSRVHHEPCWQSLVVADPFHGQELVRELPSRQFYQRQE